MVATLRTLALAAAAGVSLSACTDGYGYSGVSVGYGAGYYDDGYGYYDGGYGYYPGYDYAFGSPYWGWYGDFYYPGTGIYVYDRYRRPFRWNDRQRSYWETRRRDWRGRDGYRDNWNGWDGNRWNGGGRDWNDRDRGNWSDAQRDAWRNRQGDRTWTPEQRQQFEQRRETWRQNATPEQRQQWQQRREQWQSQRSQGTSQPRQSWGNRSGGTTTRAPSAGSSGGTRGGWRGRRGN